MPTGMAGNPSHACGHKPCNSLLQGLCQNSNLHAAKLKPNKNWRIILWCKFRRNQKFGIISNKKPCLAFSYGESDSHPNRTFLLRSLGLELGRYCKQIGRWKLEVMIVQFFHGYLSLTNN
jgi:hypothetical protein